MYSNILRITIIAIYCNIITKCTVFNQIYLCYKLQNIKLPKCLKKLFYAQDLANKANLFFLTNLKRLFYSVQYIHTEYISTDC